MNGTPKTSHGASGPRPGFTLVEVLASLALIAIILPVTMKGISLAMGLASSAKEQVEAASLAEAKLAELVATQAWQDGSATGDFGPALPDCRWTAQVSDWQGTTLRMVELSVQWTSRGRDRSLTLTTLMYTGNQ